MQLSNHRNGNESDLVTELTFLISGHNILGLFCTLGVLSCFGAKMQGEAQADDSGAIKLF